MKIFVDMDHTLNKLYVTYNDYYNNIFNIDPGLKRENLTNYQLDTLIGTDIEVEKERKCQIFNIPGFWKSIPIYENAARVMEDLYKKHDVYIVTAPWVDAPECYLEKRRWVEHHLPFFDVNKIIFTKYKYLLHGDIIIDDCPEFLVNNSCRWQIKMNYPFNENMVAFDAEDWNEIKVYVDEINEMEKKYGRNT